MNPFAAIRKCLRPHWFVALGVSTLAGCADETGIMPGVVCEPPIGLADTSNPDHVVGNGSPGSCTGEALREALAAGGVITFACGGDATIHVSAETALPIDRDTVIDGLGQITLDGNGSTRLLTIDGSSWQQGSATLTLQRISIRNFRSTGQALFPVFKPNPHHCSQGYYDGDGGAIRVRDAILHVIDSKFINNHSASYGPDTGGGAIRLIGSRGAIISGSRFSGNSGSNGGAVAGLFSGAVKFANNRFENNVATGYGANYLDDRCPEALPVVTDSPSTAGSGGNGGAIYFDGKDREPVSFCGDTFAGNTSGAFGGAVFRTETSGAAAAKISFDRNQFEHNKSQVTDRLQGGGGALYLHGLEAAIEQSTFSANSSHTNGGAIQADASFLRLVNCTFAGNRALAGVGGALADFSPAGEIVNCTFAGNHADGGAGFFAGAVFAADGTLIRNAIFSNNTGAGGGDQETCQRGKRPGFNNVQWPGQAACAEQTVFINPQLGRLSDHGGPTATMVPAGSPGALQVGTDCPATDQTGKARSTPCTVGSVELK